MTNPLARVFGELGNILGACPCCAELFYLSETRPYLAGKQPRSVVDGLRAAERNLDRAEERLGKIESALRETAANGSQVKVRLRATRQMFLRNSFGTTDIMKGKISHTVYLDSPGGNLAGGLRLGELIRKYGFYTSVGATVPDKFGHSNTEAGRCVSACAFAFVGGVSRRAEPGEIGVHQFYNEVAIRDPATKLFDALDISAQQFVSALLIDYAFRMGVDPRFVSRASATPPGELHFLDKKDLDELRVNWSPAEFEPWMIEPSGRGAIAFSTTKDKKRTAIFFCRADKVARLLISAEVFGDLNWSKEAIGTVDALDVFGRQVPKQAFSLKQYRGKGGLEIALANFDPLQLRSAEGTCC